MEKIRRAAKGELAELFGPDILPLDKFMRSVGIRRAAEEAYELMDEEAKELF